MKTIGLWLLPWLLCAQMLGTGDVLEPRSFEDQRGDVHTLGDLRFLVVTWDRETTATANDYFDQNPGRLEGGAMLVDVSQTPSGIMTLFVLPRMRSFKHPIWLSYDKAYNLRLPYEEGALSVLRLNEGRIGSVRFVRSAAELAEALQ